LIEEAFPDVLVPTPPPFHRTMFIAVLILVPLRFACTYFMVETPLDFLLSLIVNHRARSTILRQASSSANELVHQYAELFHIALQV
jgi:hypothetical protein